ncbi:MAG TPA: ABC transporter ATP-binding protein [Asticcacaulis sp.]|nr:ABC transporter ATP-binding protein [Asticcacaulis sp.]
MSAIVSLHGVELSYPIYSIRAHSLRNTIANFAIGGTLLKDGQDIVHVRALSGVTFDLHEGDRLGIIGHNGAGKTTLLKVIAGIYEPDRGLVEVVGNISSMIDIGLGLDSTLTGRENILTMGRMRGFSTRQTLAKIPGIIEFSELGQYIDLPVKTYSAGMQARLVFAVATSLDPDVLLLDEWIGAGDASFHEKAKSRMEGILEKSRILVLATHNFTLVQAVCNKLVVLDGGRQVFFGDTEDWDFKAQAPKVPPPAAVRA